MAGGPWEGSPLEPDTCGVLQLQTSGLKALNATKTALASGPIQLVAAQNWMALMTGFLILVFGAEQTKVTKCHYTWLPVLI